MTDKIAAKESGGRPATGSIVWGDPETKTKPIGVRVTKANGKRKVVRFEPGTSRDDAIALAPVVAERARYAVEDGEGVTVSEWFVPWAVARDAKGLASVRNDRARFHKWIEPVIGAKQIATLTRRDIETVVQALDRSVRAGELRWKTATNVWGVLTKMMADSCRSKVLSLRCREDNPARDVEGPDRGVERSGPYLSPAEFIALMQCPRVPVRWKRIFMLATYLYVRGGELEALEWNSVDFARGYVLIHQSADAKTGAVKPTKTKDVRKVPIEPTLLPLLRKMHEEAAGEGRVVGAMPPREDWAKRLRKYLGWAGVSRADLFADDETRRPMSFHDLRHSGITWRAVRGDDHLQVQRAAGHDDLRKTQRYINEAQTFEGEAFGAPFPAIALATLSSFGAGFGVSAVPDVRHPAFSAATLRPQGESNPR